jgi:hypothetical protein
MRSYLFSLVFVSLSACSSSSGNTPSPGTQDAGGDGGGGGSHVTISGHMIDYDGHQSVAGVTVTAGGVQSTSDAQGNWSFALAPNVAVVPVMTRASYVKLYTEEILPTVDANVGDILFPKLTTFHLAGSALANYDSTKAVLYINLYTAAAGSCASFGGTTITVDSPSGTTLQYFHGPLPSDALTSAEAGASPAAVVYNIPPGSDVHLTATHPTCKISAFPHTENGVTYTGKVSIPEGGDSNFATRFYLE